MSAQVPCTRCGDFIDPTTSLYSESGDLICNRCNAKELIDTGDGRAAASIFGASGGALAFAVISIAINPCFVFTILAIASAIGTYTMLYRHPEHRARLGWKAPLALGLATAGLLFSLVAPFIEVALRVLVASQ